MFSTLRNLVTKTTDAGNGVCESIEKTSTLLSKLNDMEGPFSEVLLNATAITDRVSNATLPKVEEAVEGVKEGLFSLKSIFSKLEALIAPLLRMNEFVVTAWSSLSKLMFSIFSRMTGKGDDLISFLTSLLPEDISVPIALIIFVGSLILLKFILPTALIEGFLKLIGSLITMVKGFVLGLLPVRFATWFNSFFPCVQVELEAQGASTFGTETSGFSFSDILSATVSMGFVSLLYSFIGTAKPGRANLNPISTILCATGDHAQKMNHLFTFFRNVKTTLGDSLLWVGEWLCDVTGFASPLSATVNMVLNTELFQWFNDVNDAADPAKRLENFSNPGFCMEASKLKDKAKYFEAEFVKFPVSPFVTGRFNVAVSKLDKLLTDAQSHKGVGQFRDEPFCLQLYGKPGCGKTMSIGFIIEDLLNRLGEPTTNRLYSLSSKDGYWSNYNHQVAVLIDDFGQILDAANQNDGVKDFIFMKSSAPMSLSMAAVEEKGTQFTSRYIFLTSNQATPPRTVGVMDLGAIQRRRNLLIEVERHGPIDETCETPVQNITFTVRDPLDPHRRIDGLSDKTYLEILDIIEEACRNHWTKDAWLKTFGKGIERKLQAQVDTSDDELTDSDDPLMPPTRGGQQYNDNQIKRIEIISRSFRLSSFQCAYSGLMDLENPFEAGTLPHEHFQAADQELQFEFHQWKTQLLVNGISDTDVQYWSRHITENVRSQFMAWLPLFTFDEKAFAQRTISGQGYMAQCVSSSDPDALDIYHASSRRSQFAFALIVRQFCAIKAKSETSGRKPSFVTQIMKFIKEAWDLLPYGVKTAIQIYAFFQCTSLLFRTLSNFLAPTTAAVITQAATTTAIDAQARCSGKGNISGDEVTHKASASRKTGRFLTAQFSLEDDWAKWALTDPFINEKLVDNLAIIKLHSGDLFRGVYVRAGWLLTVAHAFYKQPDGYEFTVIHKHSSIRVCLNKKKDFFKIVEGQDVALVYVGDIDGVKRDIVKHFAPKNGVMCSLGSKGALIKPIHQIAAAGHLMESTTTGISMLSKETEPICYSHGAFTLECAKTFGYQYAGQNGDCGSVLLLPAYGNKQPLLCGIHCAGLKEKYVAQGSQKSYAAAVYREDLEVLLPKQMLCSQVQCSVLKKLRASTTNPFEIKQVAFLGTVPQELAINVPHKTTLRKSEIFDVMTKTLGPHSTEPSILTHHDDRPEVEGFDPYVKGVEKFNETACCFDHETVEVALQHMSEDLLAELVKVDVPGGTPTVRSELEILNGIPGEQFYDSMDMSTACGYPYTLSEFGKSKRGYLDGVPGEYVLHRERPVFTDFVELDESIRQGKVTEIVSCECAKDERLPLEKIYQKPKTRLFTILPFHYNMLVRKYFLDFSASLMRAHNTLPCKVGINPSGLEWTVLAKSFSETADVGFSADYSSFDGRAPVFIFQRFCDIVDKYYGDLPGSENSLARHALLMMASNHLTLCGDKLFRVVGGMPSGFSLTVLFNSLLNEFYMRYAFEKLLHHPRNTTRTIGMTQRTFSELFIAIYGDDNLVAVPLHLRWYSLPAIAEELQKVNVVIKNGLDKNQDVAQVQFQPLGELTFLSRGFRKHVLGYYQAPLKWVSIVEPLRWIRPTPENPPIDALMQNVEGSLREAYMHGKLIFQDFRDKVVQVLNERRIPFKTLPFFEELEREWVSEVTAGTRSTLIEPSEHELLGLPAVERLTVEQYNREINEFVPGVFFCGARTAKHQNTEEFVIVNCLGTPRKSWLRGPVNWMDLENKIWAYTMSAIEVEQQRRLAQGKAVKLLFVCAGGSGISVVCAALAALASAQYSRRQVLLRYRQLTGVEQLSSSAGGAGHYLMLAAQQGMQAQCSAGSCSIMGSNIYDRCLSISNCRIITGVSPPGTLPGVYSCTQVSGMSGVKTAAHYIQNQDPFGSNLANVIQQTHRHGETLYLFFTVFSQLEAEWVLNALTRSGIDLQGTQPTDLLLLERQARLIERNARGRIWVWIKQDETTKVKTAEIILRGDDIECSMNHFVTKPLPFASTAFVTHAGLEYHIQKAPEGRYHTSSVVEAIKLGMAGGTIRSVTQLKKEVEQYYPAPGSIGYMQLIVTLRLWRGCSISGLAEHFPEPLVGALEQNFKYVVRDPTADEFPYFNALSTNERLETTVEALGLSLRLCYGHSAKAGRHVFRLPSSMPASVYVLLATYLENVARKFYKETELERPVWFPEDESIVAALTHISFDYLYVHSS
uniref:RNA1 polyprotein n=1 Tax=Lettuce necrotic leaf curl virus TaxID=1358807 RepID=A0A891XKX4_9SECO|nr:polyprotein [Lettuce necrotic leaf curl virus]